MAKIHRATVTDADLGYVGSITIDPEIIIASGIKPFQMVIINNVSNAVSWQTYVVPGRKGKGDIILNGPPARLFQRGDKVIILAEAYIEPSEYKNLITKVVFVDGKNKITKVAVHKGGAE
jgi:aspartate 1-decarboxylase